MRARCISCRLAVLMSFAILWVSPLFGNEKKPGTVYVLMVSHFDRPWVMTEDDLHAFELLTDDHPRMKWTHLYNPVAYTQPTALREKMEAFVKRTQKGHGAEIGVHLHMYQSLVEKAGVQFRTKPSLNGRQVLGSQDRTGYAVPITSYQPEEIRKLLHFTLKSFETRKLGRPKTFCAGYYATSIALQKEIIAQGFTTSAAAFPPGKEIGKAYPPNWHTLSGWDQSITVVSPPYWVSQQSILPTGKPPYLQAVDEKPLLEIPQTCKIDWMLTSEEMKTIFQKHVKIAQQGKSTVVCLAMHEMDAKENYQKFHEVLRFIDQSLAAPHPGVKVKYTTASEVRAAFATIH